jgi:hypothetical protein
VISNVQVALQISDRKEELADPTRQSVTAPGPPALTPAPAPAPASEVAAGLGLFRGVAVSQDADGNDLGSRST